MSHDLDFAYRPGVGIMLLNSEGKVFSAKRINMDIDSWQMPQGGIDKDEDPRTAAFRELCEETCVTNAEIIKETSDWLYYDFPNDLAARLWRGRYRGQRQKWFAMRFTGEDSDININTERPEFDDWKWVCPSVLPEIIVPFKRNLYKAVLKEFHSIL